MGRSARGAPPAARQAGRVSPIKDDCEHRLVAANSTNWRHISASPHATSSRLATSAQTCWAGPCVSRAPRPAATRARAAPAAAMPASDVAALRDRAAGAGGRVAAGSPHRCVGRARRLPAYCCHPACFPCPIAVLGCLIGDALGVGPHWWVLWHEHERRQAGGILKQCRSVPRPPASQPCHPGRPPAPPC